MTGFDRVLIVDWSASATRSPRKPRPDAIWLYEAGAAPVGPVYCRTRAAAMEVVRARCRHALAAGDRLLVGFDFPMGYPAGFARAITGQADALAVWARLHRMVRDAPDNANNRFEVAAALNAQTDGAGPFWGCPPAAAGPHLTPKKPKDGVAFPDRRFVETHVRSAQPCWKLYTTGSVGSQAILGIARLEALRHGFADDMRVWPFQPWDDAPLVLAEIYPSLLNAAVAARMAQAPGSIKDAVQVRTLARTLYAMARGGTLEAALAAAQGADLLEEGWILGVGAEEAVRDAAG